MATVLAGKERPEATALLEDCVPSSYLPYCRPHLDLCLRFGAEVEVPRGVVLLTGIGRDHDYGLSFAEPENWCGAWLAALPPVVVSRTIGHPTERMKILPPQPIDCQDSSPSRADKSVKSSSSRSSP